MLLFATQLCSISKTTRIHLEAVIGDADGRLPHALIQICSGVLERIFVLGKFGCWNTSSSLDVENPILHHLRIWSFIPIEELRLLERRVLLGPFRPIPLTLILSKSDISSLPWSAYDALLEAFVVGLHWISFRSNGRNVFNGAVVFHVYGLLTAQ